MPKADAQAEHAARVRQESDIEAVPKAEAIGNGHWQGTVRTVYEEDEDDAVNSPQDTHTKVCSLNWCAPGRLPS